MSASARISRSETFLVQHFREKLVIAAPSAIDTTSYKRLLLNAIQSDLKSITSDSDEDITFTEPTEQLPPTPKEPTDKRIKAMCLVVRLTSNRAYIYSPSLDISCFYVRLSSFKAVDLSSPLLGRWFRLIFTPDDISVAVIQAVGYCWRVDVGEVQQLRADQLPPVYARLTGDGGGVEILTEMCVGDISPTDGFRIAHSSELPPIADVDALLAGRRPRSHVFTWCSLRRLPYDGCHWRIIRLANAAERQLYDGGVRLDRMRVWNVRRSALEKLLSTCPPEEPPVQKPSTPTQTPTPPTGTEIPDEDEAGEVINPVVKMMFPKSEWRSATERMLREAADTEKQRKLAPSISRPTEAEIAVWEASCYAADDDADGWPSEEEHMGVICAYLEDGGRTRAGLIPPAADAVDYVVQTPALKRVALLRRDVVRSHAMFNEGKKVPLSPYESTKGFISSDDLNSLVGEWIVFKGRNDGHMLVVREYKLVNSACKTMPTRYSALVTLFSCELSIPSDFDAKCDVLMVEQLGAAVFDTKQRVRPEHRAQNVEATIACDSAVECPDALVWWIESLRMPTAGRSGFGGYYPLGGRSGRF